MSRDPGNLASYPLECSLRLRKHADKLREADAVEEMVLDLEASADAIERLVERLSAAEGDDE